MIKKEWTWMLNLPTKTHNNETINQDNLEDGIDDIISTPKETPYNDDEYDN